MKKGNDRKLSSSWDFREKVESSLKLWEISLLEYTFQMTHKHQTQPIILNPKIARKNQIIFILPWSMHTSLEEELINPKKSLSISKKFHPRLKTHKNLLTSSLCAQKLQRKKPLACVSREEQNESSIQFSVYNPHRRSIQAVHSHNRTRLVPACSVFSSTCSSRVTTSMWCATRLRFSYSYLLSVFVSVSVSVFIRQPRFLFFFLLELEKTGPQVSPRKCFLVPGLLRNLEWWWPTNLRI